jgi:DNA (cytosine-5)-methyltransferase 1
LVRRVLAHESGGEVKPLALDLFCGAGGATAGLQRAGFHVTGIDLHRQPRYCGDSFVQADALRPPFDLARFDFIWASPPCQKYSIAAHNNRRDGWDYPDLVEPTRAMLKASRKPWVIENVPGAPVRPDLVLCGSHFGLPIVRHRLFELSWFMLNGLRCEHADDILTICGHGTPSWARKSRIAKGLHPNVSVKMKREAMEAPWMNRHELSLSIPPAYAEFIGLAALKAMGEP